MKSKKIVLDIIIITAALLLFMTWYNINFKQAVEVSTTQIHDFKVYLITKDKKDEFWSFMNDGASDMASLLGLKYLWVAPENISDVNGQIDILNHVINDGADAILLAAIDPVKLSEPVKNAKAKGIKIIYVDAAAQEEAIITLATNNYEAGRISAENMLSELELKGLQSGDIGIIGVSLINKNTVERDQGFRDVIKADGKFTLLDTKYTLGDPKVAQEATENIINENSNLVGLFGTNEGSTEGMGNAIKENQNRFVGIGFDRSNQNMKLLNADSLKAIINQNPYTMGYLGVAEAFAALKGFNTGPSYIDTGVSVIRRR